MSMILKKDLGQVCFISEKLIDLGEYERIILVVFIVYYINFEKVI